MRWTTRRKATAQAIITRTAAIKPEGVTIFILVLDRDQHLLLDERVRRNDDDVRLENGGPREDDVGRVRIDEDVAASRGAGHPTREGPGTSCDARRPTRLDRDGGLEGVDVAVRWSVGR